MLLITAKAVEIYSLLVALSINGSKESVVNNAYFPGSGFSEFVSKYDDAYQIF